MTAQTTPQDFAIIAAQTLMKCGVPQNDLHFDPDKFALCVKDPLGRPVCTVNLQKFYGRYTAPDAAPDIQANVLNGIVGLYNTRDGLSHNFAEVSPTLRVQVKSRWFFRDSDEFPSIQVGEHLVCLLVADMGESFFYISNNQLALWNVSFDDAFEIALQNLYADTIFGFETYASDENEKDCAYFFTADDSFGAARLVFSNAFSQLQLEGVPMIWAPHQDHILVTGSECEYGLTKVLRRLKELDALEGALTPWGLLIDEDGYYQPFHFNADDDYYGEFQALNLKYLKWLYGQQQDEMRSQFDQVTGHRTIIVYQIQLDAIRPFSVAFVPTEGMPCSIPKVDFVIFGNREMEALAIGEWNVVAELLGDRLRVQDVYPERYHLNDFPNDDDLEAIGFVDLPD